MWEISRLRELLNTRLLELWIAGKMLQAFCYRGMYEMAFGFVEDHPNREVARIKETFATRHQTTAFCQINSEHQNGRDVHLPVNRKTCQHCLTAFPIYTICNWWGVCCSSWGVPGTWAMCRYNSSPFNIIHWLPINLQPWKLVSLGGYMITAWLSFNSPNINSWLCLCAGHRSWKEGMSHKHSVQFLLSSIAVIFLQITEVITRNAVYWQMTGALKVFSMPYCLLELELQHQVMASTTIQHSWTGKKVKLSSAAVIVTTDFVPLSVSREHDNNQENRKLLLQQTVRLMSSQHHQIAQTTAIASYLWV